MVDYPMDFRCPISMELMKEPVTISTGVTYERKNIEKWFFTYKKLTCPATMQAVDNFHITPNLTLARLILSWRTNGRSSPCSSPSRASIRHEELAALLATIQSSPFKVSPLKKLRPIVEMCHEMESDFIKSGGVEVLVQVVVQILVDPFDFVTFGACEEALGVLHKLGLADGDETYALLSKAESMKAIATMLQRGSAEGRLYAVTIFKNMAKTSYDWSLLARDQGLDFFKSLLELVSDEFCSKASSSALQVLIEILGAWKKSRVGAIEAGAMCVLVELMAESSRSRCEKMLLLMKMLCECAEGRLALVDHAMGIAALSNKMLHVSTVATKIAVKILCLLCTFHPTDRLLEEMLTYGAVNNLVALLHVHGPSSTKDKVVRMFKLHGTSWKRFTCFPTEFNDYLGLVNIDST